MPPGSPLPRGPWCATVPTPGRTRPALHQTQVVEHREEAPHEDDDGQHAEGEGEAGLHQGAEHELAPGLMPCMPSRWFTRSFTAREEAVSDARCAAAEARAELQPHAPGRRVRHGQAPAVARGQRARRSRSCMPKPHPPRARAGPRSLHLGIPALRRSWVPASPLKTRRCEREAPGWPPPDRERPSDRRDHGGARGSGRDHLRARLSAAMPPMAIRGSGASSRAAWRQHLEAALPRSRIAWSCRSEDRAEGHVVHGFAACRRAPGRVCGSSGRRPGCFARQFFGQSARAAGRPVPGAPRPRRRPGRQVEAVVHHEARAVSRA